VIVSAEEGAVTVKSRLQSGQASKVRKKGFNPETPAAKPKTIVTVLGVPLCCPACHAALSRTGTTLRCEKCGSEYPLIDGRPYFIRPPHQWAAPQPETGGWFRRHLSRPPHPARFAREIKGGSTNDHTLLREFLAAHPPPRKVLDLGSGERRLREGVLNLDIVASPAVDVVADGHRLPFPDAVFDAIVLQSVIEHVPEPPTILAECSRVLVPGGQIWVEAPFFYPVHDASDYYRWTLNGLRYIVSKNFDVMRSGALMGPSSALSLGWRTYANWKLRRFHWGFRNSVAWLSSWVKWLDRDQVLEEPPEIYALGYVLGTKPTTPK
jgi:SAM-dependent methyltransferase